MSEPCGNLPRAAVSTFLSYCYHHQAWYATVSVTHDTAARTQSVYFRECEFGPFDDLADALAWIARGLDDVELPPGVPWR